MKKPTDKTEPKFKNGQWIVWQDKCYKVNYNGCGYELVDKNGLSTSLEYGTIDENAHIYDITKDAKDGDVLITNKKQPFIFNGHYDEDTDYIYAYCGISDFVKDDSFLPCDEEFNVWCTNENVCPATKEQRDVLFSKMKDAGYEWDAEKKELKKLAHQEVTKTSDQETSEWSEEDEKLYKKVETAIDSYYAPFSRDAEKLLNGSSPSKTE